MSDEIPTLTDEVAAYFKARPGVWVGIPTLAERFGYGGWRTRLSQAKKLHGLILEKRQSAIKTLEGRTIRIVERRYVPPVDLKLSA